MRKFLALDKQSQLNLRKKFPDLDKLVAVEQTDAYTYMANKQDTHLKFCT
ncbi:hypothetical protein AN390_01812 [Pseudoalteromonas sp. P1-11]|nr:hypothetical protein AN390_01812 [Pseudoalteromonas sp. P1-11]